MVHEIRRRLISTTALTFVLSIGVTGTYAGKIVHACPASQPIRIAANSCKANPCAVKKTSSVCNPCAVKKTCNPSAVQKACNPCSAASVATQCVVPRLVNSYQGRNPCAVKKPCRPCVPCAAAKICSPCNPCAVEKTCSPCNPCASIKACRPCNPCAADVKPPPELTEAEAVAAYNCVGPSLAQAYRKSGHPAAITYRKWKRFSRISYPADAHGTRFMNNYANDVAAPDYGKWEAAGTMPKGSVLAKDSFIVADDGKISVGPLFVMEKGAASTNAATRDWHYSMIMPAGTVRRDAALQKFCNSCHFKAGAEDDNLMFLPLPFRMSTKSGN